MKKAIIISLLLFISMLGYTRAEAKVYYQVGTYKAGKFQYDYKVLEKGIWITKITPLSGKGIATLKIPSKIAGKKVVKLGADGDLVGNIDSPDRDTNLFGVTNYDEELWIVLSPKKINDRVKKIKTIKIPSTVKILTQNCFRNLQDGKNINIPAGVTKNVIGPFTYIKWNKITVSDKSKEYKVSNGCLLSRDGKKLYGFVKKKKKIVIPSTVKRIVYGAGDFNGCSTIIIPKSVNKIDKKAISTDQPVKVKIAKGNKRYAVKYGSVYSKVSGRLALGYVNNGVLKIPEKVTRIDHHGLLGENPEKINELLKRRNPDLSIDEVIKIDEKRRKIQTQADELRAKRKAESQKIGLMKKNGENTDAIQEEVRQLGDEIKKLEDKQNKLDEKQRDVLLHIPNIPDETTPIGTSEDDNVVTGTWGTPAEFTFEPKAHWDICEEKNLVDFERGVKLSQSRFTLYRGKGAKLERAIINFFLDQHTENEGYEEILPPFMANAATMTGTGQLPKFKEDMYKCVDEDLYLIPTAEVPVTNIYSGEILSEDDLPMYMTAYTPCFRREAGSAGKDTRGLIRVHQFNKVEMVKYTTPENSPMEHEKLTNDGERMLQLLGLPYRKVALCTADIGFSANKCWDLEVWMPSYGTYKEISSCSNYGDYQARRANIRYKEKATGKTRFVHTINGSGLAVGRTFAAILENCQQADGTVIIPEVLRKYTGFDKI